MLKSEPHILLLQWVVYLACICGINSLVCAQGTDVGKPGHNSAVLENRFNSLLNAFQGEVSIAVKHLPTGERFSLNEDVPMPTASLIKIAVMVEAYRQIDAGKLDLDQLITLKQADKVPGSGLLTTHFSPGLQLSVRDAIRLMIAYSDNTATNLVLDQIGLGATAHTMEELGFPLTKIHSKVYKGSTTLFPERSKEFGLGSTSARETLELLEQLYTGKLTSPQYREEMLGHLRECVDRNRLPSLLPPGTVVAHKTGTVNNVRTVAGILETPNGPVVVVVLTKKPTDKPWADLKTTEMFMASIAKIAYDHFNADQILDETSPRELAEGAQGWLVEALQRTLNERMQPSPELTVDGDFGSVTKQAVLAFQEAKMIPATGVVDATLWKELGPLLASPVAISDPEQLDKTLRPKKESDPLNGTPYVTCKAWIVGDAATGEVIGGTQLDQQLENASTTKLMTAWIAMREIRNQKANLEDIVTVSARADKTPGSTAHLQTGEKLSLQHLLFGLLLPSGNDASVVIAEHFGEHFAPPEENPESVDALVRFVAEMNRTAKELGMSQTQFQNPHGLSAVGHHTTVADLFRLARVIAHEGSLLPYVETRKFIGKLEGASGYERYELWSNTNQLLGIDGYFGMKTGTTRPAGACLVSLGERNGQRLIVVVLGATSSDARYTDTRNLFRWSWQQRQ